MLLEAEAQRLMLAVLYLLPAQMVKYYFAQEWQYLDILIYMVRKITLIANSYSYLKINQTRQEIAPKFQLFTPNINRSANKQDLFSKTSTEAYCTVHLHSTFTEKSRLSILQTCGQKTDVDRPAHYNILIWRQANIGRSTLLMSNLDRIEMEQWLFAAETNNLRFHSLGFLRFYNLAITVVKL